MNKYVHLIQSQFGTDGKSTFTITITNDYAVLFNFISRCLPVVFIEIIILHFFIFIFRLSQLADYLSQLFLNS